MAYVRVWIHAVWRTKNGAGYLTGMTRPRVLDHIRSNARDKGIHIDRLNGAADHLHCLLGLNADISIAKTMQLIKGESSHWINKEKVMPTRFEWADEYYAASVSESSVERVRRYIDNQEQHHRKRTYAEEVEEFLQHHGFSLPG